jgi:F0F1-type ATP synthase assembly protein I
MKNKRPNPVNESFRKAGPFLNIVYVLIGAVGLFTCIGYFLDQKWNVSPLFLLIGIFIGLGLGFYNMIKVIQQMERR